MANYEEQYLRFVKNARADEDLVKELKEMEGHPERIEDAFYQELSFGTGGLRGVIGAGTNRMNIYTVGKASQALADYVVAHFSAEKRKIAVSYDSRIKSDLFARVSAAIFASNGLTVYLWPVLMPTPCLSFSVRECGCAAGVMVTASHNPSRYNGYKVYGQDGCQITEEAADEILTRMKNTDMFDGVKYGDFDALVKEGKIRYIGDDVYTAFIEKVKSQTMLKKGEKVDRGAAIVYSPLNGTGLRPVTRALAEAGFENVTVVEEQRLPDGNFPTCPYPNPEIREAMQLGLRLAEEKHADLLLATDPDCDRVGIAVKNDAGEYTLLTGNETGMLLLDYVCARRKENGTMPSDPVCVKTVVTIDMADRIASHYGVRTVNVLTGFKYIGEQIGLLEKQGKESSYIFGFEESYGYLSGTYVRDKDAVNASFLICEMFAYYAGRGIGLYERLQQLYKEYGFCRNTLHSYQFEGSAGMAHMGEVMDSLRKGLSAVGGKSVLKVLDYSTGIDGLPKSNVMKFLLADNCSLVVRPSGTEPKLKVYISVSAKTCDDAAKVEAAILADLKDTLA